MAHSDKQQPDFGSTPDPQNRQNTQALARDIEALNDGIKTDFDLKLGEIADLLARFKALVTSNTKVAANDDNTKPAEDIEAPATVIPLFDNSIDSEASADSTMQDSAEELPAADIVPDTNESADSAPGTAAGTAPITAPIEIAAPSSRYTPEPARFETGLYKLNSQLYRFRLELDQEMEFREEPLHLHFRQESELSMMFQKLSDASSEKNSGG